MIDNKNIKNRKHPRGMLGKTPWNKGLTYKINPKKKIGKYVSCEICSKSFYVVPSLEKQKKTCGSKRCFKIWKSIQARELGYGKWMIGKKLPKNTIEKIKKTQLEKIKNGYISPLKGKPSWNKGIPLTEEHKLNLRKAKENEKERPWAKTGKDIPCANCGKMIYKNKFQIINYKNHYCSDECTGRQRRTCSDETILKAFTNEKLTLKEICNKYHTDRIVVKRILKINGIEKEIYDRWKERISKSTKKHRPKQIIPTKDTSIEVKIQNFLKQLGIEFFTHQYIKEIEHGYQCDILIPSMNLVIECDGDYWHKYPIGNDIDHIRTSELLSKGFKVLRLWENEIKVMDINKFKYILEQRRKR